MEVVKGLMAVAPVLNGQTRPFRVKCDDGNEYYVKFKENPESSRVLINEYVSTKIAEILDIPITTNRFVEIGQTFIDLYGEKINSHIEELPSCGLHFGSQKIDKVYPITSSKIISSTTNADCLSSVLLFDHLIGNQDRISNKGNILLDGGDEKLIVVIDHSHAFDLGPIWDEHQLRIRINEPLIPYDLNGYVYSKWIPHINGNSPFSSFFHKLPGLTDDILYHIISKIPEEWLITEGEKEALFLYLQDRRNQIDVLPSLLKNSLPYWKGGS